ncbi:unnamed protein product, partial [marine sediment metagenome]
MSEKKELLSKKGLMVIGIVSLATLIIGIILYYTNLNEAFYSTGSVQSIFKVITYLGEPVVFIIIIAMLFLSYNKTYAKTVAFSLLYSYYLNGVFKELFQDPRPTATNEPGPDHGFIEPDYGFPSGHAQTAVSFWGHVGYEFKDKYEYKNIQIVPIFMSILIFLIAISRIIIG